MALVVDCIDRVNRFFNKYGDPRVADWLFMSSPFYTLGICLAYVYVVKVLGPKFMENRKPFQFKWLLVFYNFCQVLFSIYLFNEIGMGGWFTGEYSFRCQPVDYSNKPSTLRMVRASWWYYFSKFTEFFDTVFFVLRKKNDHITTLHVIHHGVMPMSVWFGLKYTPGGHSTFFGLLNTFVHIVMYFYYMLSALGPQVHKYLWWKKYLTTLQMVQFVGIMVHAFQLLFIECNYPRAFVWWIGMHAVMFFFLFKDFYNQAYNRRPRQKVKAEDSSNGHAQENGISKQNGYCKQNGEVLQNGHIKNGFTKEASGYVQENGIKATSVSEYYVHGPTDLQRRMKSQ